MPPSASLPGPDPTELAALHEQQVTLEAVLHRALDHGCPPERQRALQIRIALLDAEFRRN